MFERFTRCVCKTLLGFHAMPGSDQTERFHGQTKKSCWNTFLKSTNDTLGNSDLKEDTDFPSLKSFVVALYCKKKVPPGVKNLANLDGIYF